MRKSVVFLSRQNEPTIFLHIDKQFFRLKKSPDLINNSDGLLNSLLEWYERNNHFGGQSDLKSGKSLRGLEEGIPCEGDFMIHWKGKGFKTILDILLVRFFSYGKA